MQDGGRSQLFSLHAAGFALSGLSALLSAGLLFIAEPLVGKMLLPFYGGAPAVWNTCMLFFQAAFLAAYLYAHLLGKLSRLGVQVALHAALLAAAGVVLPLSVSAADLSRHSSPVPSLLLGLWWHCGLPLFALAATAPLVQRWVARSGPDQGRDPYFLYAASNLGSLAGLCSFPFLLEPAMTVDDIAGWWRLAYGVLVLCIGAAGLALMGCGRRADDCRPAALSAESQDGGEPRPTVKQLLSWIVLSLVPSSLMLGVTTYISTDIAAVPLLWIIPLALYLTSFIVAFGRSRAARSILRERTLCLLSTVLLVAWITESEHPAWLLVPLHLLLFWTAALTLHMRLAHEKPAPRHLTLYYLCLAVGGMLGGVINSLAAPMLFTSVIEYPLAMVAACLLSRGCAALAPEFRQWRKILQPAVTLVIMMAALLALAHGLALPPGRLNTVLVFAPAALFAYRATGHPARFAVLLGVLLSSRCVYQGVHGAPLFAGRNFFGVLRVTRDGPDHVLVHGNTQHGRQRLADRSCRPLSYFYPSGPAGRLLSFLAAREEFRQAQVGVVGLGTGALACYAAEGQHWTFFEINPMVIAAARNGELFTFLQRSKAASLRMVEGDARLALQETAPGTFDLLVLDAFSSDSIPMHLTTREAFELYRRVLTERGLLLFHVSNRFLELPPLLARMGEAVGLPVYRWDDPAISAAETAQGKDPSQWMLFAPADLAWQPSAMGWQRMRSDPAVPLWTDRYSNILAALRGL